MVMWVFGYGSLIWKTGFKYDESLVGFIKGYRRVFYQGSTDHRGTPEYPGRTVTLEPADGEVCVSLLFKIFKNPLHASCFQVCIGNYGTECQWGVAYKISKKEDEEIALTPLVQHRNQLSVRASKLSSNSFFGVMLQHLEVREKQYDKKAYLDFFTESMATTPAISGVMVYIASPDKKTNVNYLGPASIEEIAKQIVQAEGPSGPNRDYLFQLEKALLQFGKFFQVLLN
ncbi:hypothetical protein FEM48_Zijuj06G0126900 [Ziziphus jujuba var. spinosa]|uniref:glutathione-specific gamma-glutamylcyclotransferase n=1 Tax=Ziziphus jujuba var. spinosa TaxID=714518 RepID=A0A978V9C4_ZIZJJ|nr:hypothetical protein FEM48_Zijuj06G0126900 [Ziziphus jujuba var. spinosa]